MKILFIGGTGIISSAITRKVIAEGHDLYLLNRGNRNINNVTNLVADINNETAVFELVKDLQFDVVADFIAFTVSQVERDYRLFADRTRQFIFISSASAYQKPLNTYKITESTPLHNPYWEYSRDKIACEDYLMKMYRKYSFPVTIVRPSHTYDHHSIPLGVHGSGGSWQVAKRMIEGKPVIIHGDGTSLWTLTHNSDFAKGFYGLLNNPKAIGEAFHITSDETLTWNQIYESIAAALEVPLNAVHISSEYLAKNSEENFTGSLIGDKANSVVFDNSKIKALVPEFICTTPFHIGIKQTVEFLLQHPEFQNEDPGFDNWCDEIISRFDEV